MKSAIDAIKAMGYWQTILRPVVAKSDRIRDKLTIREDLERIAISLRGWDFPHVDSRVAPVIEQDKVWQVTDWKYFHEVWCMFESGQLLHVAGMRHDWGAPVQLSPFTDVPEGQRILGMGDTLFRFTEILMFASRYEEKFCPGEGVDVLVEVGGLAERQLVVDDPGRGATSMTYLAQTGTPFKTGTRVEETVSEERLLATARDWAGKLFELFGMRANEAVLQDWQSRIGRF